MLGRASWWDGGRLEQLVRFVADPLRTVATRQVLAHSMHSGATEDHTAQGADHNSSDQAGPTAIRVLRTGEADDTTPRISRTLNAGLRPTMLKRDVRTHPPSASEIPVHSFRVASGQPDRTLRANRPTSNNQSDVPRVNAGSYSDLAHEI